MTRNGDVIVVFLWAATMLLMVSFTDSSVVRLALGAPLLLFLSGHVVLRALGIVTPLITHIVFAIGTSIAVCVAGGFLLNWIACLTPVGWAAYLLAVTGVATSIALRRQRQPPTLPLPAIRLPTVHAWQGAAIATAALVTFGAYLLAAEDEANQRQFNYTEFWMLPAPAPGTGKLLVGITSGEAEPKRFDVEVTYNGQVVALWRSITIAPGDTWTRELGITPGSGHGQKAEARLYLAPHNVIYRRASAIPLGA